jgi:hypothetical protein
VFVLGWKIVNNSFTIGVFSDNWIFFTVKQAHRMDFCRFEVKLQGFEWFVYNRTEAYDIIAEYLESEVFEQRPARDLELEPKSSSSRGVHVFAVPVSYPN